MDSSVSSCALETQQEYLDISLNEMTTTKYSSGSPSKLLQSPRAIQTAVEIFAQWELIGVETPLDRVVSAEFRDRKFLNSGERRWISDALYNVVRNLRGMKHILQNRSENVSSETLIKLWSGGLPQEELPSRDETAAYLRLSLSFPDEMADELESLLGNEAIAAAEAFNTQAPVTLRTNLLKVTRSRLADSLGEALPTRISPWGLELPGRVNINELTGFKEGWFEIQEEASQIAALLTDARPGQTIIDVGAGSGGKSLAISAMMQNQGRIFAVDTSEIRLNELIKRMKRAGARNITPLLAAVENDNIWLELIDKRDRKIELSMLADTVLIDSPCTGTGVLRRSPDAKWRAFDREQICGLQLSLLQQSSHLVKQEGALIYVTCAFERYQNEEIIEQFLKGEEGKNFQHANATERFISALTFDDERRNANPSDSILEKELISSLASGPFLRTWPHRHRLDSFFMAVLQRN